MPVWLIIILGLFVVCGLPELIKYLYTTVTDKVYEIKKTIEKNKKQAKEKNKKQAKVDIVGNNPNIVRSKEEIYFSNGFYDVITDKFDYLLSEDGNKILGPYTKIINPFWGDNSLASVLIGDDVFYIDNQGNKVLGPFKEYKCLDGWHKYPKYKGNKFRVDYNSFEDGYAILDIQRQNTFYDARAKIVINTKGEIIHVANRDNFIAGFSEGLLAIKEENKVYFIDENKKKVLGPYDFSSWTYHTKFSEGLAVVFQKGEFWYIDKTGKKVLGPYNRAYSFTKEGFACVITKDGVGCIDRQGKFIWGPSPEYHEMRYAPSDGCIVLHTQWGDNYSIVDVLNNKIVGTYKQTTFMVDGHAFVKCVNGKKLIVYKDGNTKSLTDLGYVLYGPYSYVQSTSNGRYSVNLKNGSGSTTTFYSIDHNGNMLKMSDEVAEILKRTPNLKLAIKKNEDQEEQEVPESQEEFNPFIEAYIRAFSHASQDAHADECVAKNIEALNKRASTSQSKSEVKKVEEYHVIGVQFDNYRDGCYYYYGDNKIYNINDRVLVPTSNNGNQEATIVFRKIYTQKSDIPYSGNLKWVIRKINDNGSKTKIYSNYDEIDYGCDDMCDVLYDEDPIAPDYYGDNIEYEDGPWWDTTTMSNPDDTDYE